MRKKKSLLLMILALAAAAALCGCEKAAPDANSEQLAVQETEQKPTATAAEHILESETSYYLENSEIQVEIVRDTGYIRSVTNLHTNASHKAADDGAWPFRIVMSDSNSVAITSDTPCRVSDAQIAMDGDTSCLTLVYEELIDEMNEPTGIKAVVRFCLGAKDDYFTFDVSLENNGQRDINRIDLCRGGRLKPAGEMTQMTLPMWGEMQYWTDPVEAFRSCSVTFPYIMSYPGRGWNDLEMGFADISGTEGGIGLAYINRQQTMMDFRVASDEDGMSVSPTLLNPEINAIVVPVCPGSSIQTDEVVVIAHRSDWHRTADIYREKFQKAFTKADGTPDYLTWETLSPKLKNTDAMVRYHNPIYGEIVPDIQKQMDSWGETLPGEHMMVWLSGYNEHGYGHDVPAMLPVNPAQGTEAEFYGIADYVHEMGGNLWLYEHPFAYDPMGKYYEQVKAADPHQFRTGWDGVLHENLCMDNDLVYDLWKNTIIPEFRNSPARPDGLQFDQASQQHTVCNLPGHHHGLDPVSMLSSHCAGMDRLAQMVREELVEGETSYVVSEGFCDLLCRHIDMSQTRWDRPEEPACNGEFLYGGGHYVFPAYRIHCSPIAGVYENGEKVQKNMRQFGAIMGGITALNEGAGNTQENCGEYIWFKNEMRRLQAPGYPYNYRDTVGLTWNDEKLAAKVFTEANRLTVTLWNAGDGEEMELTVSPAALGLPGEDVTFQFRLQPNRTGYIIYNAETGETEQAVYGREPS